MSDNNEDTGAWKTKLNDIVNTCQSELKKTTQIGMKMLSASQSNSELHDTYEALGRLLKEGIENQTINLENEEIDILIAKANKLEADLEGLESEVQNIKKSE